MVAKARGAAAAGQANGLASADAMQDQTAPAAMIPMGRASGGELTFYDRVPDPMAAVEKLGEFFQRSGMFGCDKPGQGAVLALACFCERRNPIELLAKYHLIDGRLSAKAEWMRAEFRRRGGRYRVLEASDFACSIEWEWEGQKIVEAYTIGEARQAGLVRPKSAWEKTPADMLFARCTSRFMRRYAPEISGGAYTPEEIEELRGDAAAAVNSEAAVEERRRRVAEELLAAELGEYPPGYVPPEEKAGEVVRATDAEFSPAGDAEASAEQHQEIVRLGKECGLRGPEIADGICERFGVKKPSQITAAQADELITDFRGMLEKKRSAAAKTS